ncbi:PKS-ER domain-containing protein [Mycena venus]|uniref:PKS-ER domain-containing protein n=1 Tax=Mycena venus TaxID=2733690 RepID=A0A8H7CZT8_9AGAR|nr:PKS-ER domain-containing protein [Mycena venus]
MAATHTAIAALAKGRFDAIQVERAKPGAGEVLVKIAYASMIAFDTYITDVGFVVVDYPVILGFNGAGTVAEIGAGVTSLAVGDRVTGFQPYGQGRKDGPKGTMQEFVVMSAFTCAKVPDSIALDAAATVPDNFITSFYSLFDQLALPIPTSFPAPSPPPNHDTPILVYGAGSTTGQYALQLLHAAGYTNVIATASAKHHALLRTLGATHVFDYASPTLAADIARAVGGDGKIALALDAITAEGTIARIAEVLSPQGTVALLLPIKAGDKVAVGEAPMYWEIPADQNPLPASTTVKYVRTFTYAQNEYLKNNLMPKILPDLLASGLIQPNRVRLLDQGTFKERVGTGLDLLRNNKISGEKVIVKVP